MKALTFSSFGPPDVMEYIEVPEPKLQEGDLLVKTFAIGLNFADIYRRKGKYHLKGTPPFINGYEGAGVVVESKNTKHFVVGDRIGFADVPFANAEYVCVPEDHAIPLPDFISFEIAASILLQGLTAQYLVEDSYEVKANDKILIHACAGGVGQLMIQLVKFKNAIAIGLTSNPDKMTAALNIGADKVFLYDETWKKEIMKTYPEGIDAVYDSIGTTLNESLFIIKEKGTVVFFGFAGGDPPQINPHILMDGSKTITGGDLWTYLNSKEQRQKRSAILFDWIKAGVIKIKRPSLFPLKEGVSAHYLMESRRNAGKIVLIP